MNEIYCGDIRDIAKTLPDQSVNCIVTSPPYFGLRDYGVDKQIGLEETPEAYVDTLVGIFRELKRVLRDDGTIWVNLGDSYAGGAGGRSDAGRQFHTNGDGGPASYKHDGTRIPRDIANLLSKNLIGIPWRVAFALQADGWYLRSDIIWHKKNPMPESVTDRPTKAHEYIFLLSKQAKYYYDNEAVKEDSPPYAKERISREKAKNMTGNVNNPLADQIGLSESSILRKQVGARQPGRNRRTVWTVSTRPYKAAHFAVFPPDLIRPCILAGCPQQVCGECGKPWVRVIKQISASRKSLERHGRTGDFEQPLQVSDNCRTDQTTKARNEFQPACNCNADTKPGVVLDPFIGSGTVAQVAIETGRNWLGVELNPEYIELAKERIYQTQPALPIEAVL